MFNHGSHFNVAHIESSSEIYGPGKRFVIWLQGCSLACPGCWNRELWSFEPKRLIERNVLLSEILECSDIEGVTLLGGEPLQQAQNVYWLLSRLKEENISSMLYTGYEIEEINTDTYFSKICDLVDILVPGRYMHAKRDLFLRWRGSSNQQIVFKTDRYSDIKITDGLNEVEITIDEYGTITFIGYPEYLRL